MKDSTQIHLILLIGLIVYAVLGIFFQWHPVFFLFTGVLGIIFLLFLWSEKQKEAKIVNDLEQLNKAKNEHKDALYFLDGYSTYLFVYSTKVVVKSKNHTVATMARGIQGDKSIPFTSITAIEFRQPSHAMDGCIEFIIQGGQDRIGGGGLFIRSTGINPENSCVFNSIHHSTAIEIRDYIEKRISEINIPQPMMVNNSSLADEIKKLADLKDQGLLSDTEFLSAKQDLLKHK